MFYNGYMSVQVILDMMESLPVVVDTWDLAAKYNPHFLITNRCRRGCRGNEDFVHRGGLVVVFVALQLGDLGVNPTKIVVHILAILEIVEEVWRWCRIAIR
jgi:hypothetical protein